MKSLISVVIVHWNTPDSLKKLLTLLKPDEKLQVTVIDNNSDKSVSGILKAFPRVSLIQNKKNLGFAKACNQGASVSKEEWLVFLNPDVLVGAEKLFNLIDNAKEKGLDAFSLVTKDDYRKPLPSGLSLLAEFTPLKYLVPLSLFPKKTLIGGLLFIKRSVLQKIGGWDERFFLWFEDSDLTKRLYDGGYRVDWIKSDIKHLGGESFQLVDEKKRREFFFSSMNKYADKHLGIFGKSVARLLKKRYVS